MGFGASGVTEDDGGEARLRRAARVSLGARGREARNRCYRTSPAQDRQRGGASAQEAKPDSRISRCEAELRSRGPTAHIFQTGRALAILAKMVPAYMASVALLVRLAAGFQASEIPEAHLLLFVRGSFPPPAPSPASSPTPSATPSLRSLPPHHFDLRVEKIVARHARDVRGLVIRERRLRPLILHLDAPRAARPAHVSRGGRAMGGGR